MRILNKNRNSIYFK